MELACYVWPETPVYYLCCEEMALEIAKERKSRAIYEQVCERMPRARFFCC